MLITHWGHSCVLVEAADSRILLDPGGFSAGFESARDLSAIVVTHQHPDHLDPSRIGDLVRANPQARVFSDPGSAPALTGLGIEVTVQDGTVQEVGSVRLEPVGEWHALIHPDLPIITNVGVKVVAAGEPTFYHPGDALDGEPGEVDIVAFPLQAPWQRSRDMVGFLRRLAPPVAIPIHDGLLQARGRALYLGQAANLGPSDTRLLDLAGADATDPLH